MQRLHRHLHVQNQGASCLLSLNIITASCYMTEWNYSRLWDDWKCGRDGRTKRKFRWMRDWEFVWWRSSAESVVPRTDDSAATQPRRTGRLNLHATVEPHGTPVPCLQHSPGLPSRIWGRSGKGGDGKRWGGKREETEEMKGRGNGEGKEGRGWWWKSM